MSISSMIKPTNKANPYAASYIYYGENTHRTNDNFRARTLSTVSLNAIASSQYQNLIQLIVPNFSIRKKWVKITFTKKQSGQAKSQ